MKFLIAWLAGVYAFFSIMALLAGFLGARSPSYFSDSCSAKPIRIEAYFPTYRLGCYLFGVKQ